MKKYLIPLMLLLTGVQAQSGFDILNTPTDTRDAARGVTLNPIVKPTLILTRPEHQVTLNVWNWVAGVQGATMGIGLEGVYLNLQAMHSGELEYRNAIPTEEPLSTFEYTLFDFGGAHARQFGPLTLGLGAEFLYERTLNASAAGLSLNLATAYTLHEKILLGAGLRHFGITGKLDTEASALPGEVWLDLQLQLPQIALITEWNSGSLPLAAGARMGLADNFEILAGFQLEPAEPTLKIHPSAGFTAAWNSFTFGSAIYQLDHNLGPRHFISLYWNY